MSAMLEICAALFPIATVAGMWYQVRRIDRLEAAVGELQSRVLPPVEGGI